jgi:hypothetical protein
MTTEIHVSIDAEGNTTIDVRDAEPGTCRALTGDLERKIGKVRARTPKNADGRQTAEEQERHAEEVKAHAV